MAWHGLESCSWTNVEQELTYDQGDEMVTVQPILDIKSEGRGFCFGFYCRYLRDECLLAVVIYHPINFLSIESPELVWSANRNDPVRVNATLQLTGGGDLILKDADGKFVWSTNTTGKSVSGLKLTEAGDVVLFDANNATVWQSFDHPTDALLQGQKMVSAGKKLTASLATDNRTEGMLSLSVTNEALVAYVESNPPQFYYRLEGSDTDTKGKTKQNYILLGNENLDVIIHGAEQNHPDSRISIPANLSAQFIKLGPDGHLRAYGWKDYDWEAADLLTDWLSFPNHLSDVDDCQYPLVCGKYGICSERQCSCPPPSPDGTNYFRPVDDNLPSHGCYATKPIACGSSQYHHLLELQHVCYFAFSSDISSTNVENCKQACLNNCSCKAAVFKYTDDPLHGDCCLLSEVFSLMTADRDDINSFTFLKVAVSPIDIQKKKGHARVILVSSLAAFFGVFIFMTTCFFLFRKKKDSIEFEEDYLDQVSGMPTRFSFQDLKSTTQNFSCKLGEGGFGSVYEGTLSNGAKVAVKHLEGLAQVKKSFSAEVETIGSIHHVNLVRLIGFCAEKSHRLLVYEYMCNGSLDKWIFHKNQHLSLGWESRRKIILDIAKGLAYLHEECRQKIFHLDIKPQNILLDEHLNAKVSDFGLSKLIDKDQSQVVTTMRGTPGYLAPEWLSSVITEKVDVYSFGVVLLEILCGRRNVDRSQPEEDLHLLGIFRRKANEGQVLDMVDKNSEDMQGHGAEVMELMKVAAWCLQNDYATRPSMSVVVKALEGLVDIEGDLDYNFSFSPLARGIAHKVAAAATPIMPSALSGPR
ncbi:G-type lectin S-receptor-like serine/threonine-protein kinase SD2-5 [Vitis vinifera]|uniref:G-type lectin S-receptor-like serine/threonine-protein kinase SD2-5 n=1 Tax=Vitis vinifera TaxID=29760 RepID=UPI00053F98DC|nr:G-type lectin S-receptor-like serine/threonine-protein kinase SD2-5 [Vitis vinifera]|eukprot:XP_010657072.1 PREDICTED: G-type lectin S-receptor-like serine/threonine-protein kinase SD2-5 [Vitis vinifera]